MVRSVQFRLAVATSGSPDLDCLGSLLVPVHKTSVHNESLITMVTLAYIRNPYHSGAVIFEKALSHRYDITKA